ncbi:Type II secretion system protein F [Roseovarius litorisediminis]|uniref:Type II secretion system protein F n=1 Tax=Roseovarius litorisediminis TaxID=1312363 RepID=A0A1Y5SSP9_9RHOB|nr:type II secretion system F family protein [Roseovarius litorisediminis]SLN47679.1 Type II secretion system protein F [Roseovarius litorisediminis]
MKAFAYTAFNANGQRKKGTLVAESEVQASEILRSQGLFAEEISAKGQSRSSVRGRRQRLNADMRAVFTRQMAVLLSSDLSAEVALETVRSSGTSPAIEAAAAQAKAALLDGQSLSESLESADAGFPRFYVAAVRAGEVSGDVSAVFEGLADYLESVGSDKAQLATALIYPAFVAGVSLLVCGILMVNVAPEIAAMFEVSGRELPQLTQFVMAISDWIQAHWIALLVGLVCGISGIVMALRVPRIRDRWHNVALALPVIGRLLRLSAAAQYLRTLALVISSRQTVVDAVTSASDVLVITRFRNEAQALAEAVRSGESLSQGLTRMSLIPPVCRQLIDAGEKSARLGKMTERSAVLVETWLTNERKRVAALLDPLLMMLVGGMVLVIVLAILLPIFDLQAAVG